MEAGENGRGTFQEVWQTTQGFFLTQARQVASYFTEPCGVCIYSGKHYK